MIHFLSACNVHHVDVNYVIYWRAAFISEGAKRKSRFNWASKDLDKAQRNKKATCRWLS